jgi:hypothetical protein
MGTISDEGKTAANVNVVLRTAPVSLWALDMSIVSRRAQKKWPFLADAGG